MIVRVKKRPCGYVMIDRRALDDRRLSWCARGLLAYLLARPDDWEIRFKHLAAQSPGSEYQVRKLLKELAALGYAKWQPLQQADGKLSGSAWVIYELPNADQHRDCEIHDLGESVELGDTPKSGRSTTSGLSPPLPNNDSIQANNDSSSKTNGRKLTAAAISDRDDERTVSRALLSLTSRGVDDPIAQRLVETYDEERIRRQVANYDRVRPKSVGWLVRAIEEDFAVRPAQSTSRELLTFEEARSEYEARTGGGDPNRPFSRYFETVQQPDSPVRFRRID